MSTAAQLHDTASVTIFHDLGDPARPRVRHCGTGAVEGNARFCVANDGGQITLEDRAGNVLFQKP